MATALRTAGFAGHNVGATDLVSRITDIIGVWHERIITRRQLASLDARMLDDIGVSSADVHFEASKPFWRA